MGRNSGHGVRTNSSNNNSSNSLNPNNSAFVASVGNRAIQLNPNNERYQGGSNEDVQATSQPSPPKKISSAEK
jgi:hypothetical protein